MGNENAGFEEGLAAADRFVSEVIVARDDDPALTHVLPGHCVAADDPFAAFGIALDREDEILDDRDIAMDLDMNRTQFTDDDLGGLGPKTDPFFKPGPIDIDRAFMAEP